MRCLALLVSVLLLLVGGEPALGQAPWVGCQYLTGGSNVTITCPDTVGRGGATISASGSGGSGGAPTTATYITQTPDATLSAEQALSLLTSGLLLNTTATGVLTIYPGATCTNQFIRSLSAAGAATCASVGNADLTNSATTVNGVTCTLGSTCTVTAAPSGAAGGDLSGTYANPTVAKVNAVSYPASPSTHTVPVVTASNTVTYKSVPDCTDTGGNHLNYTQSTDAFSCGTSSSGGGGGSSITSGLGAGRCTLESGVPVSATDQAGKTTVYYTPFNGNQLSVYNGSTWDQVTFSEVSIALGTLTSGLPYDVFGYNNAGTLTLELLAWSSATARATDVVLLDGVYVKTGAATRRWLCSLYTTSTTTTEDSQANRLLYNANNQVPRTAFINYTTSHTYNSPTIRQVNADTSARIRVMFGGPLARDMSIAIFGEVSAPAAAAFAVIGFGVDSTTVFSGSASSHLAASFFGYPSRTVGAAVPLGYHAYNLLEQEQFSVVSTFYRVVLTLLYPM
jgi:hypothetical protein